jgi:hypothetical protein
MMSKTERKKQMITQKVVLEWSDEQSIVLRDSCVATDHISPEEWIKYCSVKPQGEGWRLPSVHILEMAFKDKVPGFQDTLYLTDRWLGDVGRGGSALIMTVNMSNGSKVWVDMKSRWGGNPSFGDGQYHSQPNKKIMIRLVRYGK